MIGPSWRRLAALACLLFVAGSAVTLAGCGGSDSGKPVAAATAPQLDALLQELAGPGVEVGSVVAPTADVHDVELRPSQVRALRDADLIFRPGRGNDAWADEAIDQVDGRQVDLAAHLSATARHWWMDPAAAEQAAREMATELDRLDPAGEASRAKRLAALVTELKTIDAQTARCLATVPEADRRIVTDHDAASAYADRYDLAVVGTISPGAEPEAAPSAQRIVDLTRQMKTQHVKALFPIAPHGSELSATIAERGGATLGAPLWADALPPTRAPVYDDHGHRVAPGGDDPTLADAARFNLISAGTALGANPGACSGYVKPDESG